VIHRRTAAFAVDGAQTDSDTRSITLAHFDHIDIGAMIDVARRQAMPFIVALCALVSPGKS
jgi:hypothetical protein